MSEWWQSDSMVDLHYRSRYQDIYGYDPMDPPDEEWTEDDIDLDEEE